MKQKKKILVTGAQGFIGSVLTTKLHKLKKYQIIATDIGFLKIVKHINLKISENLQM